MADKATYTPAVGFDPYRRIRRARTTRRGDLIFLLTFSLVIVGLLVWAFV